MSLDVLKPAKQETESRGWREVNTKDAIPKTIACLKFEITGLNKKDINDVKEEIDKCCVAESENIIISGSKDKVKYSDIICSLGEAQVLHTSTKFTCGVMLYLEFY